MRVKEKIDPENKEMKNYHSQWFKDVNPDMFSDKMHRMLYSRGYQMVNGGVRIGIVDKLLKVATKPKHLKVAIHAITIWNYYQRKRPVEKRGTLTTEVVNQVLSASARLGVPEIGVSFMQMPWIHDIPFSQRVFTKILRCYAMKAQQDFLLRLGKGLPPIIPRNPREILLSIEHSKKLMEFGSTSDTTKKTEEEGEEEEGEEEKKGNTTNEDEDENSEASKTRFFRNRRKELYLQWLRNFLVAARELQSTRHNWPVVAESFHYVAGFYAAIGDLNAAKEVLASVEGPIQSDVLLSLTLSLVKAGDYAEVERYAPGLIPADPSPGDGGMVSESVSSRYHNLRLMVPLAYALATQNLPLASSLVRNFKEDISANTLGVHFGISERKLLLKKVLEGVEVEDEEVIKFIEELGLSEGGEEMETAE
eukprot:TRINITY_DN11044_c0_g1_i3.p1 TRINITY_DN11044_c0_g1~~TRINITY_DN11044_c0_g1_i3.p1  ORF type:complete len:421 (+),score=107.90 TRINITY_DN11044_c0_g1_i3:262-1524(+)